MCAHAHPRVFDRAAGAAYLGTCRLRARSLRQIIRPERALNRAGVDRVDEVNLLTKLTVVSVLGSFTVVSVRFRDPCG